MHRVISEDLAILLRMIVFRMFVVGVSAMRVSLLAPTVGVAHTRRRQCGKNHR